MAIVVGGTQDYVLAFGLVEGWDREQLELSMNSIRQALNSRIFRYNVEKRLPGCA